MAMKTGITRWLNRFRATGESLSAGVALAFACTLVATLGAAAFLGSQSLRDSSDFSEQREVRSLGLSLARSAESMLAHDDVSSLRHLLIDLQQERGLSVARITLPDGRVVADAESSRITPGPIPAKWEIGPIDTVASLDNTQGTYHFPISVADRGSALLELKLGNARTPDHRGETITCMALIMVAGLLIHLLIYRRVRSRLASLSFIRDSLLAIKKGSSTQLADDPYEGDEATAWNELIAQTRRTQVETTLERAQAVLGDRRDSKLDLESAVDGLSIGILVLDPAGKVRHANGAAANLLQQKRDALVGANASAAIPSAQVNADLASVLRGSTTRRTAELRLPSGLGESILKINMRPLRREDAGGVLVTLEDVTQQKSADAARNSFVAQATHELRTPLTNMRLCIEEGLEKHTLSPDELSSTLNMLNEESRRLERIVGDMLTVSEIETGSLKLRQNDVKLDRLFQDLSADFEAQVRAKHISFEMTLPPKYPVFVADRDKLMLALHNLVGNALKYTPDGGKVSVEVACEPSTITVIVKDSGIGIGPEDMKKLFSRFFRANDPRVARITGSGLGLALSREIARLHGGDVTVESELNKGSTFKLSLRIAAQALAA